MGRRTAAEYGAPFPRLYFTTWMGAANVLPSWPCSPVLAAQPELYVGVALPVVFSMTCGRKTADVNVVAVHGCVPWRRFASCPHLAAASSLLRGATLHKCRNRACHMVSFLVFAIMLFARGFCDMWVKFDQFHAPRFEVQARNLNRPSAGRYLLVSLME